MPNLPLSFLLTLFALTVLATEALRRWTLHQAILAQPTERGMHSTPTPTGGGLAFALVTLAGWGYFAWQTKFPELYGIIAGALALALIGAWDDRHPLPARLRLGLYALVAVLSVGWVQASWRHPATPLPINGGWVSAILVFWLLAMMNSFNFMDGLDGLTGLQAGIASIGMALLLPNAQLVALAQILAVCVGAFLLFNWNFPLHRARIFMGDSGSVFLGYCIGILPLLTAQNQPLLDWHRWGICILPVWAFLFDTGFTLLRRIARRENLLQAHRSHLFQRLILAGKFAHWQVSLLYGGFALAGVWVAWQVWLGHWQALLLLLGLAIGLVGWVAHLERKETLG
ncbi:MAG TPA: glycosyltransferase family 4 protein [Anaerolineales bacterium]|nr:glycosyltransferase family 4 protein [Anaerolineales bacterium]